MTHAINFKEQDSIRPRINPWLVLLLALIGTAGGCASGGKNMTEAESACAAAQVTDIKELPPELSVDDRLKVDCLLPGMPINLGNIQWMGPSRPAIISAWECRVQGGQYPSTNDSNGRATALKVWQSCADQGDKVAQNYLGEIYARNWGTVKPDFSHAAEWFRKAAEQGYSRAQKNLGVLYEQGLGVPNDPETAFKLYRQAMGQITPISLNQNTKAEIQELSKKLDATEKLLRTKQAELDNLKKQEAPRDNQAQQVLLKQVNALNGQVSAAQQEHTEAGLQLGKTEAHAAFGDITNMGRYYALIIGIDDYKTPPGQLKTPVNDAVQVEKILRQKYGFITTLLTDETTDKPTRTGIYAALLKLQNELQENDNLLIYYAGHGQISANEYYWLAKDADSINTVNWISSNDIKTQINRMKAKHVLVVADSCYSAGIVASVIFSTPISIAANIDPSITTRAGTTATASGSISTQVNKLSFTDTSPEMRVGLIKAMYELPSRTALTSGGFEPVVDNDSGNGLSIFANAFLRALTKNDYIIDSSHLFPDIREEVFAKARPRTQIPVYAPIQGTDDNFGEFFFVSRSAPNSRQSVSDSGH